MTTSLEVSELYFEWLVGQINVGFGRTRKTYLTLFRMMLDKEFVWSVPNDDNRVEDALELRDEFVQQLGGSEVFVGNPHTHLAKGASVLEVLIGLSRRLAFFDDGRPESWAWQLVVNLEMHKMCDPLGPRQRSRIDEALDALIWRTYDKDGQGGFFPLAFPTEDQRNVELWYQMSSFIDENQIP